MFISNIPKPYLDWNIPRPRDGFSSANLRNNFTALASGDFLPFRAVANMILETHDYGTDVAAAAMYSGTGCTVTTEKTVNNEGIACLKVVVDATGNREVLRTNLSTAVDLSDFTQLGTWIKCLGTASSIIQFVLEDSSGNQSYWNLTTYSVANTWLQGSVILASPDSDNGTAATLSDIVSYGWKGLDASETYYFDTIHVYIGSMKLYVMQSYVGDYFYPFYDSSGNRISYAGGITSAFTVPSANPRIDLLSYNPDPGSGETYLTITQGSELASPTFSDIPACPTGHIPLYAVYIPTTATKIVEYYLKDVTDNCGYIYADLRPLYGASGGGASATTGTFTNASLSTGKLTITHSKKLTAPYAIVVEIFDNSGEKILPDNVTGSINSVEIDLTSYGTLSGTWGYSYIG